MKRFFLFLILGILTLALSGCFLFSSNKIETVYQSLFADADLSKVTTDLFFPKEIDDVSLSWYSDNWDAIDNEGHVTRGEEDVTVTIDIALEYEGKIEFRKFVITVLKRSLYPINKAKGLEEGENVIVNGVVIGKVGNDAYIHDGVDGIFVKNITTSINHGDFIAASGTIHFENEQLQLMYIDIIPVENVIMEVDATSINDFSNIDVTNQLVNLSEVEIVLIEQAFLNGDTTFGLIDQNNNEMELLIRSKHEEYADVVEQITSLPANTKVNLKGVVVNCLNRKQVEFVQEATIEVLNTTTQEAFYPSIDSLQLLDQLLEETEVTVGLPSLNEVHALIIPVEFTDYRFSDTDLSRIETAFIGTSEQTGWESVQSYYEKSSYGKLDFTATILEPLQTNHQASYYSQLYKRGFDAEYEIIKQALEHYNSQIDYSLFDQNNDNYIDALYFIYSTPVYYEDVLFSQNNVDLWWAYVYQYFTDDYEYYDGVEANYYLWAGLDFIDEPLVDDGNNPTHISVNASTYIHETGHMLGLEDYYDYNEDIGIDGGLGGADMMDYTVGDHNPFTKIILGWTVPLVVTEQSTTITLSSFSETGDVIMINPSWEDSYYDEYLLIDFFLPNGLNEAHAGYRGLFSEAGVRIFHVDARIDENYGSPLNEDGYYSVFSYNNSDTNHKLIKLIEADGNYSIESTSEASNEDLFSVGDIFGKTSYPNYRWYDGTLIDFTIEIISISETEATIKITYK
ncbi:MAG: immunoglobulin-like domain-containing protein [Bacilli bacterium]